MKDTRGGRDWRRRVAAARGGATPPPRKPPQPDEAAEGEPHEAHPGSRLVSGFPRTVESGANGDRLPLIFLVLENGGRMRNLRAHGTFHLGPNFPGAHASFFNPASLFSCTILAGRG